MVEKFDAGKFVKEIRQKTYYEQETIALIIGYPGRKDIVSKIENGKRKMSADELFAICQYFDVDIYGNPLHEDSLHYARLNKKYRELSEE